LRTRRTLATDDTDIRVYIGGGVLVEAVAVSAARTGHVVEVMWLSIG
jgi:hypothetical protein